MCRQYATTPDVAARLLAPGMRDLTRACIEYERAERVVREFRTMQGSNDETQKAIAARWRENGDGPFFASLLRAAGRTQPRLDEV